MARFSQNKGKIGERELASLLTDLLGQKISRQLSQSRDGGHDLMGCGEFCLEVKRVEQLSIESWWKQACSQAIKHGGIPALAYRQSRNPWRVIIPMGKVFPGFANQPWDIEYCATLSLHGFAAVVREGMQNTEEEKESMFFLQKRKDANYVIFDNSGFKFGLFYRDIDGYYKFTNEETKLMNISSCMLFELAQKLSELNKDWHESVGGNPSETTYTV